MPRPKKKTSGSTFSVSVLPVPAPVVDLTTLPQSDLEAELFRRKRVAEEARAERIRTARSKRAGRWAQITRPLLDLFAPKHDRRSCNDENYWDGATCTDEGAWNISCVRCTILEALECDNLRSLADYDFKLVVEDCTNAEE